MHAATSALLMPCGQAMAQIRHRRFMPKAHAFQACLHYLWLDADQLPVLCAQSALWSLARWNLLSINPADLLGQGKLSVRDSICQQVQQTLGQTVLASDHIRLLTLPHALGLGFNSVSFYFVFREQQPLFILSEITNTPWRERYTYVLDCLQAALKTQQSQSPARSAVYRFEFDKQFHVSPFMPMQARYQWRFKIDAAHFVIDMKMLQPDTLPKNQPQKERISFDATMQFELQPLSPRQQTLFALKYPLQGPKMLVSIYWQAMQLLLKKVPFYRHPQTVSPQQPAPENILEKHNNE
jgi:DUF1365 family protein